MDPINSTSIDTGSSQANNSSYKRKASKVQGTGAAPKKQRTQPQPQQSPRRTRAQGRKRAAPNNTIESDTAITVGDFPEPADTAQMDAPLPNPAGQPPVSSNIRAALCDSIDYWKAHQGGIQSTANVATGMLLNGKTTPRDILQAQVIVTTVYVSR